MKSKIFCFILTSLLTSCLLSSCYIEWDDLTDVSVTEESSLETDADHIICDTSLLHECEFERVVDGDTIIVHDKNGSRLRVRLTGINAPESVHPDEEMNTDEGRQASSYLKDLLSDTEYVYLEYDVEQFDQYDRTLAYVWIDTDPDSDEDTDYVMLNELMLKEDLADPVYIEPNLKYADIFRQYE